jgi:hypothetical protein
MRAAAVRTGRQTATLLFHTPWRLLEGVGSCFATCCCWHAGLRAMRKGCDLSILRCAHWVQCASLCDANDAGCCCDPGAVLQLTTTIDDSSYGPQGGFLGYSGSNHSTHSVRFVPPVLTGLPAPGSPGSFTRTLTYEVCMTANNGEGWIHCPGRRTDGRTDRQTQTLNNACLFFEPQLCMGVSVVTKASLIT